MTADHPQPGWAYAARGVEALLAEAGRAAIREARRPEPNRLRQRTVSLPTCSKKASADGRLKPGQEIVEASTGNTGIALAMIGRRLGHPVRIVVPETVFSDVTRSLMAFEPQIEWVAADLGIKSAIDVANRIAKEDGAYLLNQFGSPDNPRAHFEYTAVEILEQQPDIDVFVCGLGTGGTASGVGRRLKEHNPALKVVGAEPHPGGNVQGIHSMNDGYIPPNLDLGLLDAKILVRSVSACSSGSRAAAARGVPRRTIVRRCAACGYEVGLSAWSEATSSCCSPTRAGNTSDSPC